MQTLHAFCERLLRLFPFEANVPAHFKVIDERESKTLMAEARLRAIGGARPGSAEAHALELTAREAGSFRFSTVLAEALPLTETFEAFENAHAYGAALRRRLRLETGESVATVQAEMLGGDVGRRRRRAWAEALETGSPRDRVLAAKVREADGDAEPSARVEALLNVFFTEGGEGKPAGGASASLITKPTRTAYPALDADLQREQTRLDGLRAKLRSLRTLERSEALFIVGKETLEAFRAIKADRGVLDFADQTARALKLVTRSSAAWVMHKLDYALDHLLIDEAQDTSPEQWEIIAALTAELFSGASARRGLRTVFAVGDEKQSIFSFQGAAPEQFAEMGRFFSKRHKEAELRFESVPLHFSFRSAQTILNAVDQVFASAAAWSGVAPGEAPPQHHAVRTDLKGLVELWPPIPAAETPKPSDWRMPLDALSGSDPGALLARRIASVLKEWLAPASRERIAGRDGAPRRIRPGDVMILVRQRNAFFDAMIKALKDHDVEVAGADRLRLNEHIAVMDLIAAGRAVLTPDDDLSLACALKSPLLGFDDEGLFTLASGRPGSLWEALRCSADSRAQAALARLSLWRERARSVSPYDFYARLLGQDGGRQALIGRLGPDASDPIDEFLALAQAHERRQAPSLVRFLAEVEADEEPVKRDMENEAAGVRVLTVHASKGLEAPVVFLPDTCGAPNGQNDPQLFRLAATRPGEPPLFAWSRKSADDCETLAEARRRRREADAGEHRRLLYVAMTRASQRLIIAGYETRNGRGKGCWHELVRDGLRGAMREMPAPWGEGSVFRLGEGLLEDQGGESPQRESPEPVPAWLTNLAAPEGRRARLRPSRANSPGEEERENVKTGRLAHALLHMLPEIEAEKRRRAGLGWLAGQGGISEPAATALLEKVLRALGAPNLAPLFGPGSRSEVPFAGILRRPGRPDLPYTGRLDRMVVTDHEAWIADFKLGGEPARPARAHITQLATYKAALAEVFPQRSIRASLVYLDGPSLKTIAEPELDSALEDLYANRSEL